MKRFCGFCGAGLLGARRFCSRKHYFDYRSEKRWSSYIWAGVEPADVPISLLRNCSVESIEDIRNRLLRGIPHYIVRDAARILRRVAREERIASWKYAYGAGLTFTAIAAKCRTTPQAVRQAVAAQHDYTEVKASHLRSLADMAADGK